MGQTIGADDEVRFVGNISRAQMENGDHDNLFIGANNILYWPNTNNKLKGFRAYFKVPKEGKNAVPHNTPARIVVRQDTPTDIDQITNDQSPITNKIIKDNRLIILRDGKRYNVLGYELK